MDSIRPIRPPSPVDESRSLRHPLLHANPAPHDSPGHAVRDLEQDKTDGSPGVQAHGYYLDREGLNDTPPDELIFERRVPPRWKRFFRSLSFLVLGRKRQTSQSRVGSWVDGPTVCCERLSRRPRVLRGLVYLTLLALMLLGILQFITIVLGALAAFFPDDIDWAVDHWGEPGEPSEAFAHWPTDFTGDIKPVACHSHNDYWRHVPLYSAISAGCIGVEADIWLFDEELYVGHTTMSLTTTRTLKNLYIDPLLEILDKQNPVTSFHPQLDSPANGVFDTDPDQTLVLLLDFKTNGADLWPRVHAQLQPLREKGYLTYFNGTDTVEGPITVVGTGYAPFDLMMDNGTYRDVFFDAPLDEMAEPVSVWKVPDEAIPHESSWYDSEDDHSSVRSRDGTPMRSLERRRATGQGKSGTGDVESVDEFNPQTSYYASVSFKKSIGHIWRSRLTAQQLDLIRQQVRGAHRRGLKVRYWGIPSWPIGVRNHIWHVLVREGVDILNVDDVVGATRRDWRRRKGWWY